MTLQKGAFSPPVSTLKKGEHFGQANEKFRDCRQCSSSLLPPNQSRFAQYTSHIGAQFNTSAVSEVPVLKQNLYHINDVPFSPSYKPQKFIPAPQQTYQLARFLNEPADYKSLLVVEEDSNGLVRKETHMSTLQKRIKDVDSLVGDM